MASTPGSAIVITIATIRREHRRKSRDGRVYNEYRGGCRDVPVTRRLRQKRRYGDAASTPLRRTSIASTILQSALLPRKRIGALFALNRAARWRHRQRAGYSRNEVQLHRRRKQRGVGDVPAGAHLFAGSGTFGIALGFDFGAGFAEFAGAGVDRHRRVHQARQDHAFARMPKDALFWYADIVPVKVRPSLPSSPCRRRTDRSLSPAIDEILMPITPAYCCLRMIGITCFAARMQLFRLIATQRSNASSDISSNSASPPASETPATLLCRISMRPQRPGIASATMPSISATPSVTS